MTDPEIKEAAELRRRVVPAQIAELVIGAPADIAVQSMTTTSTLDTESSVAQALELANAGARLVRLTAQGVNHAANLRAIHEKLREVGCNVPLVADIHFNPAAAFEAAKHVEKVRINPGNFFDPGRTFRKMTFTDEEYSHELDKIRDKFVPFLQLCRENHTALRIGVNHGSLSDRIMSRFGDGAEGMVESAMEFLRICRDENFSDVVVSIKASDVPVMTDTVRLLVKRMEAEDMAFPLHLGVTEAGNALEGRIKSSVGIGSLLSDGIGDTIRVSLSEDPVNEIPVAKMLVEHTMRNLAASVKNGGARRGRSTGRRKSYVAGSIGGNEPTGILYDTVTEYAAGIKVIELSQPSRIAEGRRIIDTDLSGIPYLIIASYPEITDREELIVAASCDLGSLLLDGYCDAVGIKSPLLSESESADLCRKIIQAAGLARYQAEIVACPGCGRTLFGLPESLEKVKQACIHLKHLKIAVMGCIVNGPGEMTGADYGYVGAAAGNVSIYRGTECIRRNIPQEEALDALINLIKADGQWTERP